MRQHVVFARVPAGIHRGLSALARERGQKINQVAREILYSAIVSAGDTVVEAMREGDAEEAAAMMAEMEMETQDKEIQT